MRWRAARRSRDHRAGPWLLVNLGLPGRAAGGRQRKPATRSGRRWTTASPTIAAAPPAGRPGAPDRPSSAPVAGSRRTKPACSGTTSHRVVRAGLRRGGQAERGPRPEHAPGGRIERRQRPVDPDQRDGPGGDLLHRPGRTGRDGQPLQRPCRPPRRRPGTRRRPGRRAARRHRATGSPRRRRPAGRGSRARCPRSRGTAGAAPSSTGCTAAAPRPRPTRPPRRAARTPRAGRAASGCCCPSGRS